MRVGRPILPFLQISLIYCRHIDSMEPVTRDDIKAAVLKAWDEMPESVILNSFEHLKEVHEGIVERKGGNRNTKGT